MRLFISKLSKSVIILIVLSFFIGCDKDKPQPTNNIPAVVTSLSALPSDSSATLTWTHSDTAENYIVYLSTKEQGTYKPFLTTVGSTAKVTNLENDKTYWIKVVARNIHGKSKLSSAIKIIPTRPSTVPAVPTITSVSSNDRSIIINWQPVISADSYDLYFSNAGAEYVLYGATVDSSMVVSNSMAGSNYKFYLVAVNSIGKSAHSAIFEFVPTKVPAPSSSPANIVAISGNNAVTLYWTYTDNASSYAIFTSDTLDGTYAPIGTTQDNYFTVKNLQNNKPYYFKISAVNFMGISPMSEGIASTPNSIITKLNRPTGVIATPEDESISLSWDTVANANNYNIYISNSETTGFKKLDTTSDTKFKITGLQNDTVYYIIITASLYDLEGEKSLVVAASAIKMVTKPLAPKALYALSGDTLAYLSWEKSVGATHYEIYKRTATVDWMLISTITANEYLDKGLINDKEVSYKITAVNVIGRSDDSLIVSTIPRAQTLAPSIIDSVSIKNIDDYIMLTWGKNISANYYNIYQKKSTDTTFELAGSSLDDNFIIKKLEEKVSYDYYITAVSGTLEGEPSSIVSITYMNLQVAPEIPINIIATAIDKSASISWDPSNYAQSYVVYLADKSDGIFKPVLTTNLTTAVINFLSAGSYNVQIVAKNNIGDSMASSIANFVISAPIIKPDTIKNLTATAGDKTITLTWDNVANASTYAIYMSSSSNGVYTKIDTISTVSYTKTGLVANQTVYFYIKGVNSIGEGNQSSIVSATPYESVRPGVITGLVVTSMDKQISFTWVPADHATSYLVEVSETPGNWRVLATVTLSQFSHFNLTNGIRYGYRITSMNDAGSGSQIGFSAIPNIPKVIPKAPTYIKATSGNDAVLLEFLPVSNAVNYDISYRLDGSNIYTPYITTSDYVIIVKGLKNGRTYTFMVRSKNNQGTSEDSITADVLVSGNELPIPPSNLSNSKLGNDFTVTWSNNSTNAITIIYINLPVFNDPDKYLLYAVTGMNTTRYIFRNLPKMVTNIKLRSSVNDILSEYSKVLVLNNQ